MSPKYMAQGTENGTNYRLTSYGETEEDARRGLRSAAGVRAVMVYKLGDTK